MWPISIIFIVLALITSLKYYTTENKKYLLVTVILAVLGYGNFIAFYTDTLFDAVLIAGLFIIGFLIMWIPCWLKKNDKGYLFVFIFCHLVTAILLSTIKKHALLDSPSYITSTVFLFSYLYLLTRNLVPMKAIWTIILAVAISLGIHLDYTFPNQLSFWPDKETVLCHRSKATLLATETFKRDHPDEYITYTETTYDSGIYVYIVGSINQNEYFYKYDRGRVEAFDNTMD